MPNTNTDTDTHTPTHTPTRQEVALAYLAAMRTDNEFQAELVRQFGEAQAGDKRYRNNTHDEATAAACSRYQAAAYWLQELTRLARETGTLE